MPGLEKECRDNFDSLAKACQNTTYCHRWKWDVGEAETRWKR